MAACKTVLCDICHKVHVPANKQKIKGQTVCVHCRNNNEKRTYDEIRQRKRNGKQEQKTKMSENKEIN